MPTGPVEIVVLAERAPVQPSETIEAIIHDAPVGVRVGTRLNYVAAVMIAMQAPH